MNKIKKYQALCTATYKDGLGLHGYTYANGTPVKVHVPKDTATNGIMIVGAYPSAYFHTIGGIRDVPVADHQHPFSDESYFDGSRLREVRSGKELTEHYLEPLGISRNKCWITDLVKVFLFKPGHVRKYEMLGYPPPAALRNRFKEYAVKSMPFLHEEIMLARPKVILLLGIEVISAVLGVSANKAGQLIKPEAVNKQFGSKELPCFALPHPGIVMRNTAGGTKWRKILKEQLAFIRKNHL